MKNLVTILAGVAVFLGGIGAAAALSPRINRERRAQNLTVSDEIYNLPPEMAISQAALGTFRGLAINILWQRAERLKEEGKYYEAINLGKLITRLQPHFPGVWEWVAWNQAYNISVATSTPEERWHWVKSGIDVLQSRGGGIDANPHALSLYQQLGLIYFHKIGEYLDNMSWTYKTELAEMWHSILGAPPRHEDAYIAWLEPIVKAPDRVEDLPAGAQRLIRWLESLGAPMDRNTIKQFTIPVRIIQVPAESQGTGADGQPPPGQTLLLPEYNWPEDATQEDIAAAVAFLRRKVISGPELNMDPEFMLKVAQEFGPLDWRQPATHSLYWSRQGLERVASDDRAADAEVNTHRNVLNALQTLAQSGQVIYEPTTEYISYLPSWNFWLAYDDYYQNTVRHSRTAEQIEEQYGGGYRSQMDLAIAYAYTFGDPQTADALYTRMQDRYRGTPQGQRYTIPLDDFVFNKLAENIEEPKIARGTVVALLTQSMTNTVAYNRPREAEAQFAKARQLYDEFKRLNPNPMDPIHQEMGPFEALQMNAIANFVSGIAGPQGIGAQQIPIEVRAGVYHGLSDQVKAVIYIQNGQDLRLEARRAGLDPDVAFPPPPPQILQEMQQQMNAARGQPGQSGTRTETN